MTTDLKISVIIPVYNGERTLRQCLNSILRQDYNNFEIIVVDNNSTDDTKKIIQTFQKKDKRILYVFEPYRSRGAARNKGIEVATGEIIAMTDSDCVVPDQWIAQLIAPIRFENESIVSGFQKDSIENFWTKNCQEAHEEHFKRCEYGDYITMLDTKNFAITSELMKRYRFNRDIKDLEDFELTLRLRDKERIRHKKDIIVKHYHYTSALGCFLHNFHRGYCMRKIYNLHKKDPLLKNDPFFGHITGRSFLLHLTDLLLNFRVQPFGRAFFTFFTNLAWRLGIVSGKIF